MDNCKRQMNLQLIIWIYLDKFTFLETDASVKVPYKHCLNLAEYIIYIDILITR